VLFDQSASAPSMGSLLAVGEAGNLIADAGPMILPERSTWQILLISRPTERVITAGCTSAVPTGAK
jgi:hypothetical protein